MIKFCPNCQSENVHYDRQKKYTCSNCGWVYFQNPAAAVMCILTLEDKILMARRAKEPAKGKLDCPGGFIDPDESAEEALARELYEELKLDGLSFKYLGSAPNTYDYKNIIYPTCDIIFTAELNLMPTWFENTEIESLCLLKPNEIDLNEISFPSVRKAISLYDSLISTPKH